MSPAYVHLLLNHIPTIGTVVGLILLIVGLARRNGTLERAAMVTFIVASVFAGIVYLTGEGAEDAVEGLPGVTEALIGAHEESAGTAIIVVAVLGVVSIVALWGSRGLERITSVMRATTLVIAIGVFGLVAYTAMLGGRIRHTEIRPGAAATVGGEQGDANSTTPTAEEEEEE